MDGYYARVQRHRRMLAEQAARTEEAAVSSFDWVCAPVDGITEAVVAAVPHRHARGAADRPTMEPGTTGPSTPRPSTTGPSTTEPAATGPTSGPATAKAEDSGATSE